MLTKRPCTLAVSFSIQVYLSSFQSVRCARKFVLPLKLICGRCLSLHILSFVCIYCVLTEIDNIRAWKQKVCTKGYCALMGNILWWCTLSLSTSYGVDKILESNKADVPRNINPHGGHYIFAGCLFFRSADFLDLEQCCKHPAATWRSLPGDCSVAARFPCRMAKIFGQRPGGHRQAIFRWPPVDRRRTKMNPPITGRSSFDGRPVIGRGPTDVLLVQFATRVCNFQCL